MPNGRRASRSRGRIPEIPGAAPFAVGLAWAAGGAQCSASVLVLRNYESKRMHDRNTSISPAFSSQLSSYHRSITILVALRLGGRDSMLYNLANRRNASRRRGQLLPGCAVALRVGGRIREPPRPSGDDDMHCMPWSGLICDEKHDFCQPWQLYITICMTMAASKLLLSILWTEYETRVGRMGHKQAGRRGRLRGGRSYDLGRSSICSRCILEGWI